MLRTSLLSAALTCASWAGVACLGSSVGQDSNATEVSGPAIRLPEELLSPNEPRTWELSVHCGAGFLSVQVNGKWWRTSEVPYPRYSWMPDDWPALNSGADVVPVVLLINSAGDELRVTHAGRTVTYGISEFTEADGCD